jgi:hypothetical protein
MTRATPTTIHPLLGILSLGGLLVALTHCDLEVVKVRIVDRARNDGSFSTRDVVLETLESLDQVRGTTTTLYGAATLRLGDLEAMLDHGANREEFVRREQPVAARWVTAGDVAVASDYPSLSMFTTYALMEQSAEMFRGLGVRCVETPIPTHYAPRLSGATSLPTRDNAFYQNGLDLFVILPDAREDRVPTGLNAGVIAHEYTHRVWYYELYNGSLLAMLPDLLAAPDGARSYNLLRAAGEGVADYFGARAAGDPDFVADSVPGEGHGRDLAVEKVVDPQWISGDAPTLLGAYDPYALGGVLAAALWELDAATSAAALPGALVTAMRVVGERVRDTLHYDLGDLERAAIVELPLGARADACATFAGPYAVVWDRFATVCP